MKQATGILIMLLAGITGISAADSESQRKEGYVPMQTQVTRYTAEEKLRYAAWPSIIRLSDGSLLLAYTLATQHYGPNYGRTRVLKSTDSGATWRAISEIAMEGYDCLGNNLLQDSAGNVWINHRERKGMETTGFSIRKSTDGGHTWGDRIELLKATSGGARGKPIELTDGRIAVPVYYEKRCVLVLFDPRDASVVTLNATNPDDGVWNEWSLVQIPDTGMLVGFARSQDSTGVWRFASTDSGQTWSRPILFAPSAYTKPGDNQSPPEAQIIAPGVIAVMWAYDRQKGDCRLAISRDGGMTTEQTIQVFNRAIAGKGMYPSFCRTGEGEYLAVFYFEDRRSPSNIYALPFRTPAL